FRSPLRRKHMPVSTMTSKGQTTVPKEVREALDLVPGAKLRWEVKGGKVAITTERPLLWELEGFIKHGEPDAVKAVAAARKMRGRVYRATRRSRCHRLRIVLHRPQRDPARCRTEGDPSGRRRR